MYISDMENLNEYIKDNISTTLVGHLDQVIIKMFNEDGIDWIAEKEDIRIFHTTDGNTMYTYKNEPYCAYGNSNISFGMSDDLNYQVRAEITLKKMYTKKGV